MAASAGAIKDLHLCGDAVRETGRKLGKGAYGEVVEVEYLGTLCAAKRIHPILEESGSHPEEGFRRECQTWSQLRHPNIVQLLGLLYKPSSASKLPMIVMEKMNCSLRQFVERNDRDRLPMAVKVDVLFQVAQGLAYLHGQRPPVVHRDLSPNNILINIGSMTAKLSDFGVAKVFQLHQASRMTSLPGTPAFMPPETLPEAQLPSKDYGDRIDVFSYGGVLICTLTHMWPEPMPPVARKEGKLVALNEVERRQKYIDLFTAEEKADFLVLVQHCLEFEPMDRPTSQEILETLRSAKKTHPGQSYVHLLQSLDSATKSNMEAEKLLQKRAEDIEDMQELNSKLKGEISELTWERDEAVTKLKETEDHVSLLQQTLEILQDQVEEQEVMLTRSRNEQKLECSPEGLPVLHTEPEEPAWMEYQEAYSLVGEEPTNRLMYSREFLLSYRNLGICLEPPTDLFYPGVMELVAQKERLKNMRVQKSTSIADVKDGVVSVPNVQMHDASPEEQIGSKCKVTSTQQHQQSQQPSTYLKAQATPKRATKALLFVDPTTSKPLDLGGVVNSNKSKSPDPATVTSPTQDAKREEFLVKITRKSSGSEDSTQTGRPEHASILTQLVIPHAANAPLRFGSSSREEISRFRAAVQPQVIPPPQQQVESMAGNFNFVPHAYSANFEGLAAAVVPAMQQPPWSQAVTKDSTKSLPIVDPSTNKPLDLGDMPRKFLETGHSDIDKSHSQTKREEFLVRMIDIACSSKFLNCMTFVQLYMWYFTVRSIHDLYIIVYS